MATTANKSRIEILGADGNPIRSSLQRDREARMAAQYRHLRARYDAAVTDDLNKNHWANADLLSARAAANPEVRRKIRSRARYECLENNSFARGMILTMANDVVGIGPNLRVEHSNRSAAQQLEHNFRRWMRRVQLAETLRTMISSKVVDGEIFAVPANNSNVRNNVQLDIKPMEADYCTDLSLWPSEQREDGIEFNAAGYPIAYNFLEHHPGDFYPQGQPFKTKRLTSDQVIHFFRKDRPGQRRGISWVVSALPLFALLRRYTLATCHAAETAAEFAGVMFAKPDAVDGPDEVEAGDMVELAMRMMVTLPQGWEMKQVEATQPTTTYKMFRDAVLCEIARCLNMPFNKASGDSSGYNFASGRLDHQTYFEAIAIERSDLEMGVLDRIYHWWLEEAVFIPGEIPDGLGPLEQLQYTWRWPRHTHIDPQKQASADETLFHNGFKSDEEYCLENGLDPEEHYESLGRQQRNRRELGLPLPGQRQLTAEPQQSEEEETTDAA